MLEINGYCCQLQGFRQRTSRHRSLVSVCFSPFQFFNTYYIISVQTYLIRHPITHVYSEENVAYCGACIVFWGSRYHHLPLSINDFIRTLTMDLLHHQMTNIPCHDDAVAHGCYHHLQQQKYYHLHFYHHHPSNFRPYCIPLAANAVIAQ